MTLDDDYDSYPVTAEQFALAPIPKFKVGQNVLLACTVDSDIEGLPDFEGLLEVVIASVHAYHDRVEYGLATLNGDGKDYMADNVPSEEGDLFCDLYDYEANRGSIPKVHRVEVKKPRDRSHLKVVK